ncbi:MAG: DNA-processing protein DprA [candidate division KSB1 bacterium]|nr:DNA-processing protein DprA [candidate division KSB1 bacterium]
MQKTEPQNVYTSKTVISGAFDHVGIFGSRHLSESELSNIYHFSRALCISGSSIASGGALGADSAALAAAVSLSQPALVYLPGRRSQVPRGQAGAPWTSPAAIINKLPSDYVIEYGGGSAGTFQQRCVRRSAALIRHLAAMPGRSAVCIFISMPSYRAQQGGSWHEIQAAQTSGFVLGQSLFVFICSGNSFRAISQCGSTATLF